MRATLLMNERGGALALAVPQGVCLVSLEAHRTPAALPPPMRFPRRERPDAVVPPEHPWFEPGAPTGRPRCRKAAAGAH